MRFFGRSVLGLFLAALTVGLLALAGQLIASAIAARMADGGPATPARERVFAANVVMMKMGRIVPELTAFGEVRSTRTLEVRALRGGRVVWLADGFADGAAVSAGQLLLRLDPAEATSARDLARAAMTEAEAEQREAEGALILARDDLAAAQAQAALRDQALARQNDLAAKGLGSAAAVETAALAQSSEGQAVLSRRAALAQAEARVDRAATALSRAEIGLAEAERGLADTEVFAEFAGRLDGVVAVAGGIVGANEQLARIIDPDTLEVAFRISTAQYTRLIDAQGALIAAPVTAALDVLGTQITAQGTLSRVGAAVTEGTSGRLVYATLDAPRGFRPGDFVTVAIAEPALDGVALVPGTAVNAAGTVLALGPENRLQEVPVDVLRRQGDDVIIRADALAGREVVAERSPLLGAGIKITPVRPGAALDADPAPDLPDLVELTTERRAELIAFVEGNTRMPADAKARVLEQLAQDRVPAGVIARLEQRMGG